MTLFFIHTVQERNVSNSSPGSHLYFRVLSPSDPYDTPVSRLFELNRTLRFCSTELYLELPICLNPLLYLMQFFHTLTPCPHVHIRQVLRFTSPLLSCLT